MWLVKYLTVTLSVALPAEINILFPPDKHDLNNSVSLTGFSRRQQAQWSWSTPVMIYSFCWQ